jgi:hypothetical protein
MIADAAASKLDETKHRFSAASAAWLSRLQLRSALIAKHRFSSSAAQIRYFGTVDDTDASTEEFQKQFPVPSRPTTDLVFG